LNPPHCPAAGSDPSPENKEPPGVLVVDDDATVLHLLQTALPRVGFQVWTANSGSKAIELLQDNIGHIHVALLDVRMPHLDGPQTLQALRAIDASLPACFMTGYSGTWSYPDLYSLGIVHIFEKPFDLYEVSTVLRQTAQRRL
jgi:DNA-binding NtrC family response regulator